MQAGMQVQSGYSPAPTHLRAAASSNGARLVLAAILDHFDDKLAELPASFWQGTSKTAVGAAYRSWGKRVSLNSKPNTDIVDNYAIEHHMKPMYLAYPWVVSANGLLPVVVLAATSAAVYAFFSIAFAVW